MADDQPRRQERGRRRMASILDAAAGAFAEIGYDAATTNGIAARAGISPGSLYQFFPNKLAIAEAIVAHFADDVSAAFDDALNTADPARTVGVIVDGLVDGLVDFQVANPAAKALLAGADVSAELAAATAPLHAALCDRTEDVVALAAPSIPADERSLVAEVCVQIARGIMPLAVAADPAQRPAIAAELKRALVGYLTSVR